VSNIFLPFTTICFGRHTSRFRFWFTKVLLPISIEYLNTQIKFTCHKFVCSFSVFSLVYIRSLSSKMSPNTCISNFIVKRMWHFEPDFERKFMSSKCIKIWPCSSHLLLRNDYFIFSEYFWAKLSRLTHSVSSSKSTIWLSE
jgi:hypothetical protein